jgi:carbon storage regulator
MLVLSRSKNEQILIDDGGRIVITVVDIRGDKVRIGIEAARDISVHRREVYEAIAASQIAQQKERNRSECND